MEAIATLAVLLRGPGVVFFSLYQLKLFNRSPHVPPDHFHERRAEGGRCEPQHWSWRLAKLLTTPPHTSCKPSLSPSLYSLTSNSLLFSFWILPFSLLLFCRPIRSSSPIHSLGTLRVSIFSRHTLPFHNNTTNKRSLLDIKRLFSSSTTPSLKSVARSRLVALFYIFAHQ